MTEAEKHLKRIADRLAPENSNRFKANFNGTEVAGSTKTLDVSGGVNTIQTNLLAGRIFIFFDHPGGLNQPYDFCVDASNNAVPIHIPLTQVRTISLVVASGVASPKGTLNFYKY